MDRFTLSLRLLENGWADLFLLINEHKVIIHFENVPNDPLYSLLESAIKITDNIESTVIFHNGSQITYLSIKKLDHDLCRVEVENDYIVLSMKQFCKVMLRMFDTFAYTFSVSVKQTMT